MLRLDIAYRCTKFGHGITEFAKQLAVGFLHEAYSPGERLRVDSNTVGISPRFLALEN